jgi:ATP-dependent RNA helicase DeaD
MTTTETASEHAAQEATHVPNMLTGFDTLGLRPELLNTIAALGYEEPTPIQRQTIPHLLAGRDLLGQAATGTGKTAAFALPVLNTIEGGAPRHPLALVLAPTRELAVQVSEAMFKYGSKQRVNVVPIYGGQPIQRQLRALQRGVHVVVATPGRAIDHIKRGSLSLESIRTVILDEADEMLDMGFTEDIETILDSTPPDRQTVLFSATLPPRIRAIAKRYQRDPIRIYIDSGDTQPDKALVRQTVYFVERFHKASALGRILDIEAPKSALVFCQTRTDVDELAETMNGRGYRAEALHGGMDQPQRDRVMGRLRDGTAELLIATDVAARGLDIDTLTHVVNYDVPSAADSYVHRIGRVGRAGREGIAITLADPRQRRLLGNIERLTKQVISVSRVPTVADLRTRQIELTVAAVRESLESEDLEACEGVLQALAGVDSDRNIALAAIKIVHAARGAIMDESEIPDASERKKKNRSAFDKTRDVEKSRSKRGRTPPPGDRARAGGETVLIQLAFGQRSGIRPGDLVGAIANETELTGREIGPIRIRDISATVGVPESAVDTVIKAIHATTIKGKKTRARRFRV